MNEYNIIFTGIGGRGVIKLSKIVGEAASRDGYEVKGAEIHAMAQRGGSIYCTVRFGAEIYSPLVAENEADLLVSLELIEGLRSNVRHFIKPDKKTKFLIDTYKDMPKGCESYPSLDEIIKAYHSVSDEVVLVPATKIATELGGAYMANIAMLGAMMKYIPITKKSINKAIKANVPKGTEKMNMNVFEKGLNFHSMH